MFFSKLFINNKIEFLFVSLCYQNSLIIKNLVLLLGILFASVITGCSDGHNPPEKIFYSIYTGDAKNEQYTELKEKIIAVQNENDKRIVIITWATSIVVTLIVLIVGFTSWNNRKLAAQNAQETAKKEFISEFKVYKRKFNEIFRDINVSKQEIAEKKEEIEAIKSEIENLKFEFEQQLEIYRTATIAAQEINVTQNENGTHNDTGTPKT